MTKSSTCMMLPPPPPSFMRDQADLMRQKEKGVFLMVIVRRFVGQTFVPTRHPLRYRVHIHS